LYMFKIFVSTFWKRLVLTVVQNMYKILKTVKY
jgi:hypothetical protein